MNLYLITCKETGRFINVDKMSNDDFLKEQENFTKSINRKKSYDELLIWKMDYENYTNNVYYDWSLSPKGANFTLFKWPGISKYDILRAKDKIKLDRDVAHMNVLKITSIYFYELLKEWTQSKE